MKLHSLFIYVLLILFGSSCITTKQTNLMQDIKKDYPKYSHALETYRVIQGDQLTVAIYTLDNELNQFFSAYNSSDISGTGLAGGGAIYNPKAFNVYPDGTINFPYIGRVYVLDMTLAEIGKVLSDRLSEFAEGTTVSVSLSNLYFSVLGEMGTGRISMTSTSMNIYQALAMSLNIGAYGDRSKITIIRQTKDGTIVKNFDIRTKDIIDSEYYYIQPNDVLYLPTSDRVFWGSANSLTGMIGLISGFIGVIVLAVRLF